MAYTSVAVEGGIFPSDLLDRIATGDAEGQRPADFGLDGTRRLVDEIQSAFSDARSFWDAFQRRFERSRESKTTITREDWVVPFLELLGFYQIWVQRASVEAGGDKYPISHRAGEDPNAPPVHVVALDQELDRRDGARRSPHALVQAYLNRSDALWGVVTNGRRLRLLRDSARLAKPTYLEFDLEGMISGNLYSEFVLLYRLTHASRFPRDSASAHECLLERYYQQGIDEGGRVRDKLRDGVEEALKVLGTAFLAHPDSLALRDRFAGGRLDAPRYYRQLLRLVYRLLFLMVAEERRLIFPPGADTERLAVYMKYYSVARLRDRADRYFARDRESDLWLGLRQTFRLFRDHDAAQKLGLSALDGELFGPQACEDLEGAGCPNEALLTTIRHLSTFVDEGPGRRRSRSGGLRRRVNYAGLDVEEFGSVYESLLDFHPQVTLDPPRFDLVAGSERKQTGSYYTPPELVRELIDSALVPVMEEKLAAVKTREEKIQALLDLRVCDPAAGSGHFLLAAARRIARELAKVRSGEDEPAPDEYRHALRDVIRQCVYAVDKNPLAVDLCKVALWIEGHNAGLPLSFLDHHVKCGDSLVGVFDLKVLEEGIPDDAYKAVTGDDKTAAKYYRDRNKKERAGQLGLTLEEHPDIPDELAAQLRALAQQEERNPDDVHAKEELYGKLHARGGEWWKLKVACDLWAYAFFAPMPKMDGNPSPLVPGTDAIRKHLLTNSAHPELIGTAVGYSEKHPFFHWPLEFPDVLDERRFDVVIGNPPYDVIAEGRFLRSRPAGGTRNLFAHFVASSIGRVSEGGSLAFVVPLSLACGESFEIVRRALFGNFGMLRASHYSIRPSRLFPDVDQRITLLTAINRGRQPCQVYSTRLHRWRRGEEKKVLAGAQFGHVGTLTDGVIPKVAGEIGARIYDKIRRQPEKLGNWISTNSDTTTVIYYHTIARYWIKAYNFLPFFQRKGQGPDMSSNVRVMSLRSRIAALRALCLLNSSLFYYWWLTQSDEFHVLQSEVLDFGVPEESAGWHSDAQLECLVDPLMNSYKANAVRRERRFGGTVVDYDEFRPRQSLEQIYAIDDVVAPMYGLSLDESQCLKTYDLEFRTDED